MRYSLIVIGLVAATGVAFADADLDIREWEVPYPNSGPRDPFAESATSVWFVGQRSGYLAHLDVETGEFQKIDLQAGSGPHNLIVGSDGAVWYAGNRKGLIGRYDPATGDIEEIRCRTRRRAIRIRSFSMRTRRTSGSPFKAAT